MCISDFVVFTLSVGIPVEVERCKDVRWDWKRPLSLSSLSFRFYGEAGTTSFSFRQNLHT